MAAANLPFALSGEDQGPESGGQHNKRRSEAWVAAATICRNSSAGAGVVTAGSCGAAAVPSSVGAGVATAGSSGAAALRIELLLPQNAAGAGGSFDYI